MKDVWFIKININLTSSAKISFYSSLTEKFILIVEIYEMKLHLNVYLKEKRYYVWLKKVLEKLILEHRWTIKTKNFVDTNAYLWNNFTLENVFSTDVWRIFKVNTRWLLLLDTLYTYQFLWKI